MLFNKYWVFLILIADTQRMDGDFITVKIHDGGSFSEEGPLSYDGGQVSIFRKIDCERTPFFDIVDTVSEWRWIFFIEFPALTLKMVLIIFMMTNLLQQC